MILVGVYLIGKQNIFSSKCIDWFGMVYPIPSCTKNGSSHYFFLQRILYRNDKIFYEQSTLLIVLLFVLKAGIII